MYGEFYIVYTILRFSQRLTKKEHILQGGVFEGFDTMDYCLTPAASRFFVGKRGGLQKRSCEAAILQMGSE